MVSSTPVGTVIGWRPMRDMARWSFPEPRAAAAAKTEPGKDAGCSQWMTPLAKPRTPPWRRFAAASGSAWVGEGPFSPDLRDDLAAVATAAGVVTGHQAVR